jgi:lysophospholipase L1-like esterase
MKQVFIFGASHVYGVGADRAGWADQVKAYVHGKLFGENGPGGKIEVFNFALSGSTIEFVADTYQWVLGNYMREGAETTAILSVGGNDSKAENDPDNYVSTPEAFRVKVRGLLTDMHAEFDHIIFVANAYVDESKTTPKSSPFGKSRLSYFYNQRRRLFNSIAEEVCDELGITYVHAVADESEWVETCLYHDGLHPNQAGHNKIFDTVKPALDQVL